ncbi:purine-nucleoside phosphorylase [Oceanobacillus alkalisoli]|uniref:purine-nucleoside phosphorylase n=1 Tax=Oceanobacillus alkalisoli TaxID=2925113 RepID=UPI001EF00836|nr:purine-nucleoside phosphorylase [Oceanobacillus alkalisoli]MCF3943021.1 purine-nucleoside phosphorylase [Oceanobacillus alkalisoli]MCG5104187.1 purine-nucleoside phosphorylase [Oceanobacillus alkalisoli]
MNKESIVKAVHVIEEKLTKRPEIGLILGSGLGVLADEIKDPVNISYADIPGFPVSTVVGHAGQLVIGELEGKTVLAMQGRFHFYEGYGLDEVTFPVRVMKQIGIDKVIVTNAAGGVNADFEAGDLMLITDHINNVGINPLIGPNDEDLGVRFPDMSTAYASDYQQLAEQVARDLDINLQKGVYVWNSGPSYETPAEIRMLQKVGGDAVGMSTVPEVIVAQHSGMKVLGLSCISNMAAGILDQPLSHEEVIETTEKVREDFLKLVKGIVNKLPGE